VQKRHGQNRQPETGYEESKAPAGKATDSIKVQPGQSPSLKLLVLADSKASFYKVIPQDATTELAIDTTLPSYSGATIAQFAPLNGLQAAVVDEFGLHLIDMKAGKETLQIAWPGIATLAYSPADSFLVLCEKHNPQLQGGHLNLQVLNASSGKTVAKFEWKKNPKDGVKSIKFTNDEKFCARLVPQLAQGQTNSIEIYENADFSKPTKVIKSRF